MIRTKKHRTLRGMAAVLALLAFVVTMISVSPVAWAGKKDGRETASQSGGDHDGLGGYRYQDYEYTIDLPGGGGAGSGSSAGESPSGGEDQREDRVVFWFSKLLWLLWR